MWVEKEKVEDAVEKEKVEDAGKNRQVIELLEQVIRG